MGSSKIAEDLRERAIRSFLDIFILAELKDAPKSGYDFIRIMHKRFGMLISSGTVYSTLYLLEREGLIKGIMQSRKRVYVLTEKAEQDIKIIVKANEEIQSFLRKILLLSQS